jgi:hypothetical protein
MAPHWYSRATVTKRLKLTPDVPHQGAWITDSITDAHGARWTIEAWITIRRGHPVVGAVSVFPEKGPPREVGDPPPRVAESVPYRGLERRLLRAVPVGRYGAEALAQQSERASWPDFAPSARADVSLLNLMLPGVSAIVGRPRPRRNVGRPDTYYAKLAAAYLERIAAGSSHPVRDLATQRHATAAHVRDWLHEARERGLLSRGTSGHAGGHLTPRAVALLGPRGRRPKERRRR